MTDSHYYVDFEPIGRRGLCPANASLLDAAHQLGVDLVSLCGGVGTCGGCRVQVMAAEGVSPPTAVEETSLTAQELQNGYRLACQARLRGDVKIRVPPESLTTPQRTQVEGLEVAVVPNPPVCSKELHLPPPSMADLRADGDRIAAALQAQGINCRSIDLAVLQSASPHLREWDWRAQAVVRDEECVAVTPPSSAMLGLAVDLGTTKVAGYLLDLRSGRTLASKGTMNPQVAYGEDLITRISRVHGAPAAAQQMQELAVEAVNELAAEMTAAVGAHLEDIVEAVVVGNTAMHHLFLRLPVTQLALAPYVPAVSQALDVKARDVGLRIAPGAYVHLLPNIAGFVGADHVAVLLATSLHESTGLVLALDIGTNTEVCLADSGQMCSVSCASGPAFEGAHIKHGMRAAAGAIERLRLVDDHVEYQTIGSAPPVGLCGSGILDALAQLYQHGVLDETGKMNNHPRVRTQDGQREFVLVSEDELEREVASTSPKNRARRGGAAITITQRDVRELQLAKGAMRSGIQALLQDAGHEAQEINSVVIAGAFGSYIDVPSAIAIGMLPSLPLDRFRQVGNAAGSGARLALISQQKRAEAQQIARQVRYIELAAVPDFQRLFAEAMYLGNRIWDTKAGRHRP
jgi:uncharacterized 2Fe-2S/4Fe-4S cluster protein (DUF4445 family)